MLTKLRLDEGKSALGLESGSSILLRELQEFVSWGLSLAAGAISSLTEVAEIPWHCLPLSARTDGVTVEATRDFVREIGRGRAGVISATVGFEGKTTSFAAALAAWAAEAF